MPKVLCPRHEDTVPSCEVYEESAYCFVCSAIIPLTELGIKKEEVKERYVENLDEKRKYIENLPKKEYRGTSCPYDSLGYFLLWPDCSYYKHRLFEGKIKYKNPSGHSQPLYWARRTMSLQTLYVVEGEFNAISLSQTLEQADICSPGSASNFESREVEKNLTLFGKYANVVIVTDKDPAGTLAAISLKGKLMKKVPFVSIILMSVDANEIYCQEGGKEKLREEIRRYVPQAM